MKPASEQRNLVVWQLLSKQQTFFVFCSLCRVYWATALLDNTATVTSGPPALVGLLACSLQLPLPVIEPSRGAEGLLSFAESGRPGSSFCVLLSSSIPLSNGNCVQQDFSWQGHRGSDRRVASAG